MPPPSPRPSLPAQIEAIDRLAQTGNFEKALAAARALVGARPDAHEAHLKLASTLAFFGRLDESREVLEHALFLLGDSPASVLARRAHVETLLRLGRADDALDSVDRALRTRPDAQPLVSVRATILIQLRRLDDADAQLAQVFVANATPAPEFATTRARLRELQGRHEDGARELLEYIELASPPDRVRPALFAAVASLLEKAGEHDRAFGFYARANDQAAGEFDPDAHDAMIDRLIDSWSPVACARAPRAHGGARPIFIVGMPRSGTSLTERIIAAHPDVAAAGESTLLAWAWLRTFKGLAGGGRVPGPDQIPPERPPEIAAWLDSELKMRAQGAQRVTTKTPFDYLRLGLVPLLLPGARIIHTLRDPRDVCVSAFALQFAQTLAFTRRLDWLGRYYRAYRRLMDHWTSLLPSLGAEVYELRYETLVASPEPETRRLLEFVGLDWDDACLSPQRADVVTTSASRDQVTRPINTASIARHERFSAHLGPLLEALGPYAGGVDPADH